MTRLLAVALALIVGLTSQQLALARGQGAAAGEMVICTGGGFMTVAVDIHGQPVGPAHVCPDGVQGFAGAGEPAIAPDTWLAAFQNAFVPVFVETTPRAALPLHVSARAPPVLV